MLKLSVSTDGDRASWERAVIELEGGVFHSYGWARSWTHGGHSQPYFFTWEDEAGRGVAAALGLMRPRPQLPLGRVAARLRFNAPPATQGARLDLLDPLLAWARQNRSLVEVRLGAHDLRTSWKEIDDPVPGAMHRCEFIVDATDGIPQLTRMRRGMRSSLRRAAAAGVCARETRDPRDVGRFAQMCHAFNERLSLRKEHVDRIDPSFAVKQWSGMIDDGCAHLFLGYHEAEMVSGVLVGRCGHHAYGLEVGELPQARHVSATHVVHQVSFETLFADGVKTLNLGGVPAAAIAEGHPDHGLYKFKESMSTRTIVGQAGGAIAIRSARLRALNAAKRLVESVPLGSARRLAVQSDAF